MGRKQTEETRRKIGAGVRRAAERRNAKKQVELAEQNLVGAFRQEANNALNQNPYPLPGQDRSDD